MEAPDIGGKAFEGRHVGGHNSFVHGKNSKGDSHREGGTREAAFTGEKKVSGAGGELHAKHYAHIK